MPELDGQHPDEGTIHAWLDGALDASESARLEAHVRACAECTAHVAEARGLIAGASRVVGLLDAAPAPLLRPATTPTAGDTGTLWRLLRVTPARASIAAMLLVALGITLTRGRVAQDTIGARSKPSLANTTGAADAVVASSPAANAAPARDNLLDSAVARRLASERPLRTVQPASGAAVPSPMPSEVATATAPDPSASGRVAAARSSLSAQRDSSGAPADRARVGLPAAAPSTPVTAERLNAAARAAEAAGVQPLMAKVSGVTIGAPPAGECYRIENTGASAATWGTVPLPFVIAFEPTGALARVLTLGGAETDTRATWTRAGEDSLVLRLRRIGYSGSLALAGKGETRGGTMRSAQSQVMLDAVVATGTSSGARAEARTQARADAAKSAQTPAAPARETTAITSRATILAAVTARVVSCPP